MLPSKVLCLETELEDVTCIAFSSIGRMQMKWLYLRDKGVPVLERQIDPSVLEVFDCQIPSRNPCLHVCMLINYFSQRVSYLQKCLYSKNSKLRYENGYFPCQFLSYFICFKKYLEYAMINGKKNAFFAI